MHALHAISAMHDCINMTVYIVYIHSVYAYNNYYIIVALLNLLNGHINLYACIITSVMLLQCYPLRY